MTGTCRCGSPFLRLFDDLGCVACGRQCCWGCAVVIEAVAYCVRCAEVLLEVSPSSAEGVVRPARREPHFLNTRQYAPLIRDGRLDKPGLLTHVSGRLDRGGAAAADGLGRGHAFRHPDLPLLTGW